MIAVGSNKKGLLVEDLLELCLVGRGRFYEDAARRSAFQAWDRGNEKEWR